MKHVQEGHFLKQPANGNQWGPTLSPTRDAHTLPHTLPPSPCLLATWWGSAASPHPALHWYYTIQAWDTTRHVGLLQMNVFKLQVCALADSTHELLLLAREKAWGDCTRGRQAVGDVTVHKALKRVREHPHIRLTHSAFPPCFCSLLLALTSWGSLLLEAGSPSGTQHPEYCFGWD